jgi:predicted nucleic acid-binding protein
MILVDTNIIIDVWKNPKSDMIDTFTENDIAINGIIKTELLHGARTDKEIENIEIALSDFFFFGVNDAEWFEIGVMFNTLRRKGLNLPVQDVIIAFTALKHDLLLWTNDKHFALIKKYFSELSLF